MFELITRLLLYIVLPVSFVVAICTFLFLLYVYIKEGKKTRKHAIIRSISVFLLVCIIVCLLFFAFNSVSSLSLIVGGFGIVLCIYTCFRLVEYAYYRIVSDKSGDMSVSFTLPLHEITSNLFLSVLLSLVLFISLFLLLLHDSVSKA